jgi:hypothetical protein
MGLTDSDFQQFENLLRIDRNALDVALEIQPDMFYRVSKNLVLCISKRDAAKQELQEIESAVDAQIRRDASIAGEKVTNPEVESLKGLDKGVLVAKEELAALNLRVGKWSALKEAFLQRSYALKELVALYSANYYGDVVQSNTEKPLRNRVATIARETLNKARRNDD